jgi:undecaprenyl diphosphate synthase
VLLASFIVRSFALSVQTLEWCLELGVRMVTVYAFSTDNFKRSPEEVEQLMRLAKEKFIEMLDRL